MSLSAAAAAAAAVAVAPLAQESRGREGQQKKV